jgi:hypothetical protein
MHQAETTPALDIGNLTLCYVEDAHNVGCFVRPVGERERHRAHYSTAIQRHGVVIRACHMVVVDRSRDPLEVIWRIGTLGTVERIDGSEVTLNLGHRTLAIPLKDDRSATEQARPPAVGDRVLLRGSPIEQAAITDILEGGEVLHPERLQELLTKVVERLNAR